MTSCGKLKTAALLAISSLFFSGLIFPGFLWQTELPEDTTAPAPPGWSAGNQSFRLVMSLVFYGKWGWHPEIPEPVPLTMFRQWAFWTDGKWRGKGPMRTWSPQFRVVDVVSQGSVLWRIYHLSLSHWTVHRTYTMKFPKSSKENKALICFPFWWSNNLLTIWETPSTTKEAIWA